MTQYTQQALSGQNGAKVWESYSIKEGSAPGHSSRVPRPELARNLRGKSQLQESTLSSSRGERPCLRKSALNSASVTVSSIEPSRLTSPGMILSGNLPPPPPISTLALSSPMPAPEIP